MHKLREHNKLNISEAELTTTEISMKECETTNSIKKKTKIHGKFVNEMFPCCTKQIKYSCYLSVDYANTALESLHKQKNDNREQTR